ncbi:MAG: DNA-binding protein [Methylococcaceae bacterium]|nr:DNA-binding protein [Methylococcaceae bacterium]
MAIERIVTDEAVFEIADQLTANGEKVTNRAIWSAIGGGSMTTVSQSLRRWKERQEIQVSQSIERTPLPAALVDILHNAAAQLWDAALAETKSELEQLAQATNARIAEAHAERDDTLAELQTTAEELEQVKAERDAAQVEIDNQAQQLATSAAELATLKTELNAQTLATTQATHHADITEAARVELKARADQLSELWRDEQAAHLATQGRQQAEIDRARAEATQQAERAEETIRTLRAALEKAQQDTARLDGMLKVYESIGGKQPEAEPSKKPPRKPKQAKEV